ncbi:MAG: hypothetical protein P8Q48_03195, partial [Paracoccaceae bacterium]|nr:hypothetical protein [Paracoccaceae bacterium]
VSAIRTASCRNSSVRFSPIRRLLWCSKCYQRSGIKPRQVHPAAGVECAEPLDSVSALSPPGRIELVLANGHRLLLSGDVDADAVLRLARGLSA